MRIRFPAHRRLPLSRYRTPRQCPISRAELDLRLNRDEDCRAITIRLRKRLRRAMTSTTVPSHSWSLAGSPDRLASASTAIDGWRADATKSWAEAIFLAPLVGRHAARGVTGSLASAEAAGCPRYLPSLIS